MSDNNNSFNNNNGSNPFMNGSNPFMNGSNPFMNGSNPFTSGNNPFMNGSNPFEHFKSFMNPEGFLKSMQEMPNMDMSSFSNTMKNTAEAFSTTSQMISENMQSIFKRGSDALQKNTSEMYNTMKDAISSGDLKQIKSCQQKYIQSSMDTNINNAKEVIDMSNKSLLEVLTVMQNGFKEKTEQAFAKARSK